jgi:hypothetical protein
VQERLQKVEDLREEDSNAFNLPSGCRGSRGGASLRRIECFVTGRPSHQSRSDSITRPLRRGLIGLTRRHASGDNPGMPMGFETHSRHASVSIEPTRLASKAAIFASCCSM